MQYFPQNILRIPLAVLSEMGDVLADLMLKFIQPLKSLHLLVAAEIQPEGPSVDREVVRQPC